MLGYYNYTVILTYVGTFFGFMGMSFIFYNQTSFALLCLLLAGLCDMFDGKIASTRKRTPEEKRFGIQIDSLSDVICFGVLPALIVFNHSGKGYLNGVIAAAYMLAALIRLAWFNVDEEMRQNKEEGGRKKYLGLPVTTSALTVPLFMGLCILLNLEAEKFYPWMLLLIGIAFLTPFQLKKPKLIGKLVMIAIGIATLVIVLMGVIR